MPPNLETISQVRCEAQREGGVENNGCFAFNALPRRQTMLTIAHGAAHQSQPNRPVREEHAVSAMDALFGKGSSN
jgi:hypothetical protein